MNKATCKYFNGAFHNECCDAGVVYASVTPDWENRTGRLLRLPCHSQPYPNASPAQLEEHAKRGKCEKYTEPSDAEIEQYERDTQAMVERSMKSFAVIAEVKAEFKGKDAKLVKPCPVCGGKLHMTHAAYNGHVWGKCETEDCLAWME